MDTETKALMREIARHAAKEAVEATFTKLGFDIHEPTAMQADMLFIRNWRMAQRQVRKVSIGTAAGIVVTGVCAMIWMGIKGEMGR